jgi:hypothetical protein
LDIVARLPAPEGADQEQDSERDPEQQHRDRGRATGVVRLKLAEDVYGGDLGLERQVPRDEHDRSELADGPRECEGDAREDRGEQVREDDPGKIANEPTPSDAAASSISRSSSSGTGCTARTTKGRVTNRRASINPALVKATSTPKGPPGPYSVSSVSSATIVGSANGRSITASTTPLPGNRSRTSTQAIAVPASAFTAAQRTAAPSVSSRAETASGRVASSQNE